MERGIDPLLIGFEPRVERGWGRGRGSRNGERAQGEEESVCENSSSRNARQASKTVAKEQRIREGLNAMVKTCHVGGKRCVCLRLVTNRGRTSSMKGGWEGVGQEPDRPMSGARRRNHGCNIYCETHADG